MSDLTQRSHRGNGNGMSTHGRPLQHGKPRSAEARDLRPDAREGQAGSSGVADRLVVPRKPGNGTTWNFLRLAGSWSINGLATQIQQPGGGGALTFINERGDASAGDIQDSSDVVATGWGNLVGTLVATTDGDVQIDWANVTTWKRPQVTRL